MTCTTHPEFNADTEGLEVAKAFSDRIQGKTVIVTSVNVNGIGFTIAQAFASQSPAHLIVCGRNPANIQKGIDALKADYPDVDYRPLKIDLSSQTSVRAAATEVLSSESWSDIPQIDYLINSAGVMGIPERTLSEDGIEMHLATNHIGHWLFSCLVMPKILSSSSSSSSGSRIINLSSGSPCLPGANLRWSDLNFCPETRNLDLPAEEQPFYPSLEAWGYVDVGGKSYVGLDGYNRSKIANVLASVGVTDRLFNNSSPSHGGGGGVLSLAVHPGVVGGTDLGQNFPPEILAKLEELVKSGRFRYKSPAAGAATVMVAALDPGLGRPAAVVVKKSKGGDGEEEEEEEEETIENYGAFLEDCQISDKVRAGAVSSVAADRLWDVSERLVGEKFSW